MRGRPKKRIVDQESVAILLKKIGFTSQKITQEWRHVTAFGTYEESEAVFKLASTQKTGKMTQNEFYWNEAVNLIPREQYPDFTVPKNLSSGFYGKLFYLITDKFENPLIKRDSKNVSKIFPKIKQIAKAAFEIRSLRIPKDCDFYKAQIKKEDNYIGEKLFKSASFWAEQVEFPLNKFLKIIKQSIKCLRASPGHGDFSPRQLYAVQNTIGIIDGEHAGVEGPMYYDPAWFYIRLRIDHCGEKLSSQFLVEYKKLLNRNDQDIFWEEFKPVLIQRYIGELWGAGRNLHKRGDLKILGDDIIGNKII